MPYYLLYSGLGGGFGGHSPNRIIECVDESAAYGDAQALAEEEYESMVGMYGLRDIDQIMEEDGLDEEQAHQVYYEERDSWIDFAVNEVYLEDGIWYFAETKEPIEPEIELSEISIFL